jgi:hypothetical protein
VSLKNISLNFPHLVCARKTVSLLTSHRHRSSKVQHYKHYFLRNQFPQSLLSILAVSHGSLIKEKLFVIFALYPSVNLSRLVVDGFGELIYDE